jgi:hypothetical protein
MFEGRFLDGELDGPARYWKENGELDRARSGVYAAGERVADLPADGG